MLTVCLRNTQKILLEQAVESVRLPGAEGDFEVMPFHTPFLSMLRKGRVYVQAGEAPPSVMEIQGGIAWLAIQRLVILVDGEPGLR